MGGCRVGTPGCKRTRVKGRVHSSHCSACDTSDVLQQVISIRVAFPWKLRVRNPTRSHSGKERERWHRPARRPEALAGGVLWFV